MHRRACTSLLAFAAIVVCPAARAQVFHGVVLDSESRLPVWVAAVSLFDMDDRLRRAAVTDSAGRYELVAPGPGRYKLRVDPRGYKFQYSGEYIVQARDTIEVNFLVTYEPEPSVGSLEGHTADRRDGVVRRATGWFEP